MEKKKITIGALLLVIFSSIVYITLQGYDVRLRVDEDKTTFYVPHEEYHWIWTVSGREYNRLFDGTSIMYRDVSEITVDTKISEETNETWIIRTTPYQRGPVIKDIYYFRGDVEDEELFPIYHKVRVINASDFFYRYSVDDLTDTGEKRKCMDKSVLSFGKNMKVEFQEEDRRWCWVGWPYGSDSFATQYDIESDDETFNVRLFDPAMPKYPNKLTYGNHTKLYYIQT